VNAAAPARARYGRRGRYPGAGARGPVLLDVHL